MHDSEYFFEMLAIYSNVFRSSKEYAILTR